jgi:DNA-binding MarR family transcriptional regulator
MAESAQAKVEDILNHFAEVVTKLMIDQYQQHIAELDLTLAQAQVLRVLRRGPVPTGQLAVEMRCSAPAITQLTDRLIRKGLIERRPDEDDRRCVIVALSDDGRSLVDQFRRRRGEIFDEAISELSEADQAQVKEVLCKVVRALEGYEARAAAVSGHQNGFKTNRKK